MKKITKILIAISLLLSAFAINAQQSCAVICHNGTLVKAIGGNAIDGHLDHHSEDVLISTDCDYEIIGNECATLSVKKINFKNPIPTGLEYTITDMLGKIRKRGETDDRLFSSLPIQEILFLNVEGYQVLKYYKKN